MSRRTAAWLAWSLWAFALSLVVLHILMLPANGYSLWSEEGTGVVAFLAFVTIGALIISRHPAHRIGWLASAIGFLFILGTFARNYTIYALVTRPGWLVGGDLMVWLGTGWSTIVGWGLMVTFLLLLFPTGRLPSRRWRPLAWLVGFSLVLSAATAALIPGPLDERYPFITNPFGIESAAESLELAFGVIFPLLLLLV
ncbi:MAG: hypothetical protein M3220_19075, partial [Chloroflexota bacterium]|nr:hypothetical protein [Chloroflexota bacterium]